ncbi:WD40-repeat-containing domain protein [Scheffersomyces xylosifermentans]|uniref:WD40-repeat-containing domain protein n=1 Tax=Scheffersomyces xylosifermentans TaxID=1304137 RepID=UPI00315CDAAA
MTVSQKELAQAEREIVEEHQLKEKVVNEEFKIWKKTVPLLYDTIHTYALDYPSLAVQWLPNYTYSETNKNSINVRFLISTNTSENSQNYLKLGSLDLPSTLAPDFSVKYPDLDSIPIPSPTIDDTSDFKVLSKWKQNSEINKLEISPDGKKVLSFNSDGVVHSYDLDTSDVIDYKYHKLEGYALGWLSNESFASGSNDSQIALWNLDKPSTPIQLYKSHHGAVNGISVNPIVKSLLGSVSDDSTTQFHDARELGSSDNPAITVENKHIQNTIAFHPDIETLYATAGKDNIISLYDLRNPKKPIRKFFGHNDSVIGIKWDTEDPKTLLSWALDKRIISWDLNSLGEDYTYPAESGEGSKRRGGIRIDPCLKFIHAGHTNRVNDFDAHPKIKGLYASVGDDNLLEVWKPKTLSGEEEEEEEEHEGAEAEAEVDGHSEIEPVEEDKKEKESESVAEDTKVDENDDAAKDVEMED